MGTTRRKASATGLVCALLTLSLVAAPSLAEEQAQEASDERPLRVERHAGADRVATAAVVAQHFEPPVPSVYIVSATGFADALSTGPAAASMDAPILLSGAKALPPATIHELERLAPQHIFVVGGPAVLSDAVVDELRGYTRGPVVRLAGPSRFDTAAVVSHAHFAPNRGGPVFVAAGGDWPDALAGGATAAAHRAPLLLVDTDWLPEPTSRELSRLAPSRIVVVGGPASVSEEVRQELSYYTDGAVQWFHGATRYETAARISQTTFPPGTETVFIATGENYPDVLTGVPVAARRNAPILLLPREGVPDAVASELERLAPQEVVILGGDNAVSPASRDAVVEILTSR